MSTVNSVIRDKIVQAREAMADRLAELDEAEAALQHFDTNRGFFTVSIYDPWDAAGGLQCSCKVTKRGLSNAVEACERAYRLRSGGSLRTDGVLCYTTVAEVAPGCSFTLPLETWATLSAQPLESLQKAG